MAPVSVAAGRLLNPPKLGAPAMAGAEAPPPKEKVAGAVGAAGPGTLLDAAAAVVNPSPVVPLLSLGAPGCVVSALQGLEPLSAGGPKLKVVGGVAAGAAAGMEGTAGAGTGAGPKLNCPRDAAGPDCCPDSVGPAARLDAEAVHVGCQRCNAYYTKHSYRLESGKLRI